jgi:hypothetical protein
VSVEYGLLMVDTLIVRKLECAVLMGIPSVTFNVLNCLLPPYATEQICICSGCKRSEWKATGHLSEATAVIELTPLLWLQVIFRKKIYLRIIIFMTIFLFQGCSYYNVKLMKVTRCLKRISQKYTFTLLSKCYDVCLYFIRDNKICLECTVPDK